MEKMKSIKGGFALSALAYIILGVVLIFFPNTALNIACIVIGVIAIVYGVTKVVAFAKGTSEKSTLDLAIGIIAIVAGLVMIFASGLLLSIIWIVFGIYLIANGIFGIKRAIELKKTGDGSWMVALIFAIVVTVMGIIIVFNPFGTTEMLVRFLGIALIVSGISTLFDAK